MANKSNSTSPSTQYLHVKGVRTKYDDHLFMENRDMGPEGGDFDYSAFDGEFSITVELSEEQKNTMVAAGCPEVSMGHVMFKKNVDTGTYSHKFKRKNVHNGNTYGPPVVYDKEATMAQADAHESVAWWDHIVPWTYDDHGPLGKGSLVDIEFSLWISGKKRVERLLKVGVIEVIEPRVYEELESNEQPDDDIPFSFTTEYD